MTAEELKREYYRHNPAGHFFDHDTLKFFGERMSEMRVLKKTVKVESAGGFLHECYVLSSYQHKAPVPGRVYHYFDVNDFNYVIV